MEKIQVEIPRGEDKEWTSEARYRRESFEPTTIDTPIKKKKNSNLQKMLNDSQSINKAFQSPPLLASVSGPVHNVCDKNDLEGSNNVAAEIF